MAKKQNNILQNSYNVLFLDNLNIDLKTFRPDIFKKLVSKIDEYSIKQIIITGNLFSPLGDFGTYGRNRAQVQSNLKRIVESDSKFAGKQLYEFKDKLEYMQELFSGVKVPISYTLGSHDYQIIQLRSDQKINSIISKFEQNTLSMLSDIKGQSEFLTPFVLEYSEEIAEKQSSLTNDKFKKWLKRKATQYAKDYFGDSPIEKMSSKSDLTGEKLYQIFTSEKTKYISRLEKILNFEVGETLEKEINGYKFRIQYDFSEMTRPSKSGFGTARLKVLDSLEDGIDFYIQGRHGVFQAEAFRYDDHKYSHLLQVPAFEDHSERFHGNTSGLETLLRQDLGVPKGFVMLNLNENDFAYSWVGYKNLDKSIDDITFLKKASLQDVQWGSGNSFHTMFNNALNKIKKFNPDILNLGGDMVQGGHYDAYTVESTLPNAEQIVNDISNLSEEERLEYFYNYNTAFHRQINGMTNKLRAFLESYIKSPGNKSIYFNDGHHARLLTKQNVILSYSQMLGHNTVSLLEGMGYNGLFRETKDGFSYDSSFRNKNVNLLYDSEELVGNYGDIGFRRTHMKRAVGGSKFSQLRGIQQWAKQRRPAEELIETEHYHMFQIGSANYRNKNLFSIMHPAFQDATNYGKGNTFSKGSFADTVIGYTEMYLAPDFYIVKPVLSDKLRGNYEKD